MTLSHECSAPKRGHRAGGDAAGACPSCSPRQIPVKSVHLPPMIGAEGHQPSILPPAAEGEQVVNGLIVRRSPRHPERFILCFADSGAPVFNPRATGSRTFESDVEALQWAQDSYPLILSVATRLRPLPARRRAIPRCPKCDRALALVSADVWVCREHPEVEVDWT